VLADRYRIDGVLGTGGMGRVYRGEHVTIGRPVAIKVLHAALGKNQEAALRFQREALASGRLDHPNIVDVFDFGTLENGCLYMVMEALDGEHLGQRIDREKRIPWSESLLIIRDVLLGLQHAHDRGVVHRDVKPDNIFLATKDGDPVVKILDFGIAKLRGGITDDQQATRDGITVGTPKYLSPEQAVGGAITPAADVYSTSIVLYEMLVGRPPFDSEDPLVLLTSHAGGEVPPFRDVAPDVEIPERVEAVVRHGLGKLVSERIGSAAEYLQQIDEILRDHGIDAPSSAARRSSPVLATVRGTPVGTPTPVPLDIAHAPTAMVSLPQPPVKQRRWIAVAALALGAGIAGTLAVIDLRSPHNQTVQPVASAPPADARHVSTPSPRAQPEVHQAAAPHEAVSRPPAASAPRPTSREHAAQLAAHLHTLQTATTCAERKKAVAKLGELKDPSAVPAIKKARARGKVNACLLAAADQALKKLGSKQ
jgi:serine/threonine-protein kinase